MNHPFQDPHCIYWTDGDPAVPVFQRPHEFAQLLDLFALRKPKSILEIGTYYGGTLKQWLQRSAPETFICSVDRYDIARADNRHRYREWAAPGVNVVVIAGDSTDQHTIQRVRELGPFDWILIDGDHTLPVATSDYQIYGGMCAPGGVVILHDIIAAQRPAKHPEIQVPELWATIKATETTMEFVEDYHAAWGGLGVVFK